MRFNRKAVSVTVLATMLCTLAFGVWQAFASPVVIAVKQLKWRDTLGQSVANLPADTTYLTDENDTTRTYPVDTFDWDWPTLGPGSTTNGDNSARIFFTCTTGGNNAVTDTIYYTIEKGTGQDSIYTYNGTIAGAAGSQALAEGAGGVSAGVQTWVGTLLTDVNTPGANNIWMVPSFRIRVAGDQSGTTPKVSGLKCYIVYPKRAESQ